MCCHLNRFAPLKWCIGAVVSIPEVTKLAGKFIFAVAYTVRWHTRLRWNAAKQQDCVRWGQAQPRERSPRAHWVLPGPTSHILTLLNPILWYWFQKSIWSKSQAQREMLECIVKWNLLCCMINVLFFDWDKKEKTTSCDKRKSVVVIHLCGHLSTNASTF